MTIQDSTAAMIIGLTMIVTGILAVERGSNLGYAAVGLGLVLLVISVYDDIQNLKN